MADVRVAPNVVLSDGTTLSQLAAVDASGRLSVSLTASSATVTVDSELPAASALSSDGVSNPTTSTIGAHGYTYNGTNWDRRRSVIAAQDSTGTGIAAAGILGQLDDTSTATVTENQFAPVRISSRRALLIEGVASGTNVNVALAASSATVTVDSELPTAAALSDTTGNPTAPMVGAANMLWDGSTNWVRAKTAATLADALANPGSGLFQGQMFMMGYNGTTWDRIRTANTGRLQVDVITGGGSDTPTNPVDSYDTSSAIAAGSTDNHDTTDLGGTTKKLQMVHAGASVPLKCEIQSVINGSGTTIGVFFTPAGSSYTWRPPHRNYHSVAFSANAGFDGFRVVRTNLDASEAADVYSNIFYED